jgi:hypothetical protein
VIEFRLHGDFAALAEGKFFSKPIDEEFKTADAGFQFDGLRGRIGGGVAGVPDG